MTNQAPTFTSSNATGSFSEFADTTDSMVLHQLTGTMNFKDNNHGDSHTTAATLKSAVVSGGTVIPASALASFNTAMSSQILTDSNGSGMLRWSFSDADDDFDFLARNQTLTLTYEIRVYDDHGGSALRTVKITITGTDDRPVISMPATGTVTEQAGQTLSFSPDVAHIALSFVDQDLANTGHTATVTGVSASGNTDGILPGFLGTIELMSFFHINNVVKPAGSSSGTINTTFSAPDLAFDYLAEGEQVDITYTVRLNDNAGGITTQTVVVTVIGTNDAPVFLCGPDSENLEEGQDLSPAGELNAAGDLDFADIDLSDGHTVSTTVTAERSGGGAIPLSNAALLAAFQTSLGPDSTGHLFGEVDWSFALQNSAASFLSSGETLTLTYHVTVTDSAGGSDVQDVTITILGTNHDPVIGSGPQSAAVTEFADTTGSSVLNTTSVVPAGTLDFIDQDTGDTHTVAVALDSATWSAGGSVPGATQADLAAAVTTTLHDSTGTGIGSVDWDFAIADHDLDFLADGETLMIDYTVTISDGAGSVGQTVSVVVTGTNDAVVMTSGPDSGAIEEQANTTGSSTLDTASGTLAFADVDLSDSHSVSVALTSAIWSVDPDFVPSGTLSELQTALAAALNDSTGMGAGSLDWTFSIQDSNLDFLSAGQTLTATYDVTVFDGTTSSTQTVTVTMTGSVDDAIIVNPLIASLADTSATDDGQVVAVGNLITDAGDSAGDLGNTLSVTEVNGQPVAGLLEIAGAYGTLTVFDDGSYFYTANAGLDAVLLGQNPVEVFDFTVSDTLGNSTPTTLTLNVMGANEAPQITAAAAFGSITEDAGPTVLANGDFETGDLSGWSGFATAEFTAIGGAFGNYSARLGSLSQDVATTPGQHYTLSFTVAGDVEASSSTFTVLWDGVPVLALTNFTGGFTHYSFDVIGDSLDPTTQLEFSASTDGVGFLLDQVAVAAVSGAASETTSGSVAFSDVEAGDTHTASFVAHDVGYVGTLSLDPVSEAAGLGSVAWHFTVDNADIQFLSAGQQLVQTYTVFVTDDQGGTAGQDITVTINGANDAPTAVGETIVTNVGPDGLVGVHAWMLGANDIDPDTFDFVFANNVVYSSGGDAGTFGSGVLFLDDSTLGGSFNYTSSDGIATSANEATATVINNATSVTALNGTSGDDIIIATNGTETLDGGAGNDILVGNSGSHVMTGGTGNDGFAFVQTSDGPGTITDFNNLTETDYIAISADGFGGGLTAGMDVSGLFETSGDDQFSGAGPVFHFDTSNQTLYFSADGTQASVITVATLQAGVTLNANDLLIV
ncbi:VCBS domain-containing protein [Bradyrhizobium sp.]|uniref:beta strand repeat-containing protein n=1 Tax=Bradyrhizobium sp. TaxID=376 RepID=UPI0027325D93|nr:VCBS domain-containing protein [Bradyrhizobium sp.]MDP3074816.1 VCBS domain-containing protein [Bradyrhizobium sp.]